MRRSEIDTVLLQGVRRDRGDWNALTTVYSDGTRALFAAEIGHDSQKDRAGRLAFVDVSTEAANQTAGLQ